MIGLFLLFLLVVLFLMLGSGRRRSLTPWVMFGLSMRMMRGPKLPRPPPLRIRY